MNSSRRLDIGAIVFGAVILFAGVYYLLRNTLGFNLGELDWDRIWPFLILALGGSILYRGFTHSGGAEPKS